MKFNFLTSVGSTADAVWEKMWASLERTKLFSYRHKLCETKTKQNSFMKLFKRFPESRCPPPTFLDKSVQKLLRVIVYLLLDSYCPKIQNPKAIKKYIDCKVLLPLGFPLGFQSTHPISSLPIVIDCECLHLISYLPVSTAR